MTTIQLIVFYACFFLTVAISAFPRVALRKQPKLTGEQITRLNPNLRGIQYQYGIPLLIVPVILLVLLVWAGMPLNKPIFNETFLFFPALLFIGFHEGLLALRTGVFPATSRWDLNRFVYDQDKEHRRLAQLQVALAVLGSLLCLAMFLLYPE